MLLESELECSVETATTLGEVYMAFQKAKYDVVIIDHVIENGSECMEHILQIDKNQPILVVSDAIKCVIPRCQDCVDFHNIRRLFNPTPIKNIVRMVTGFESYSCDHYDEETNKIKS